jgi:hypothetical protein
MKCPRNAYLLSVVALLTACGESSPSHLSTASDAAWDGSADASRDIAVVPSDGAVESAEVRDAAVDSPFDGAPDTVVDLSVVQLDAATDGSTDAAICWHSVQGAGQSLPHFRFSFLAPDQTSYACENAMLGLDAGLGVDAGAQVPAVLTGRTTRVSDLAFTLDTCQPGGTCRPTLYTFTLVASGAKLTIPVGRQVKVAWQISPLSVGGTDCSHWLVALDAETGATSGMVWLLGNGGLLTPASELPFEVGTGRRFCPGETSLPLGGLGDFVFVFTSKYGPTSSLAVGTQESGVFSFANVQGFQQALDIHCMAAFQGFPFDDHWWNWDYWAINQTSVVLPTDGGGAN